MNLREKLFKWSKHAKIKVARKNRNKMKDSKMEIESMAPVTTYVVFEFVLVASANF